VKWIKSLRKLSLVVVIGLLSSCAKESTPNGALNGTYAGTYLNTGVIPDSGTVRIVFVGSNFSGESMGTSRPICNGSYTVIGDSINFTNYCSTPDPELLLVGKYQLKSIGDSLYFIRLHEQFSLKQQ
jgi:hypothetical protein